MMQCCVRKKKGRCINTMGLHTRLHKIALAENYCKQVWDIHILVKHSITAQYY